MSAVPQSIVEQITNACEWVYDDGGRQETGRRGRAGDCVVRALSIATGVAYDDMYDVLADGMQARGKPRSARNGVSPKVYKPLLGSWGWRWTPTMQIGSGCTVHLRRDELPSGVLIVRLSRHLCAVVDGVVHDTYDPSRGGERCVYGYWQPPIG